MKKQVLINFGCSLGFVFGLTLTSIPQAWAVQPTSVDQHADVPWSRLIDNPFDGKLVHDKNYTNEFAFVSTWSKQGIRATYTRYWQELEGYKPVWKPSRLFSEREGKITDRGYRRGTDRGHIEQEPVYRQRSEDIALKEIMFAIGGQVYRYEDGFVSPELAKALATAPSGSMTIRVVLKSGRTVETEIGGDTVESWKTLFR
jgi:hypothetical protein